jgi:cytochrome c
MTMLKKAAGILGFTAALTMGVSLAQAEGDASAGEKVFKKCKACHVVDKEKNRLGPHLVGIMGRAAGSLDGFKYSKAMIESGLTWDEATLDAYLADPKGYVPKNKMAFPGLKKEADRVNVIAYLKSATGG